MKEVKRRGGSTKWVSLSVTLVYAHNFYPPVVKYTRLSWSARRHAACSARALAVTYLTSKINEYLSTLVSWGTLHKERGAVSKCFLFGNIVPVWEVNLVIHTGHSRAREPRSSVYVFGRFVRGSPGSANDDRLEVTTILQTPTARPCLITFSVPRTAPYNDGCVSAPTTCSGETFLYLTLFFASERPIADDAT